MKLLVIPAGYTYIPVNVYLIYFMQGFIYVADRALLFPVHEVKEKMRMVSTMQEPM